MKKVDLNTIHLAAHNRLRHRIRLTSLVIFAYALSVTASIDNPIVCVSTLIQTFASIIWIWE
jgi:hypothetical protein